MDIDKTDQTILKKIASAKLSLPRKQKQLCDYMVENYQKIGVLTVSELAEKSGVGASTVIRVMKALGYETFNAMKKDFHNLSVQHVNTNWWHMKKSFENEANGQIKAFSDTWEEMLRLLDRTWNESLVTNFQETIDLMLTAKKINILGLRSSRAPAMYFDFLLSEFYPKTKQLSNDMDFIYDRILQFEEGEIIFMLLHAPYTKLSLEIGEYCYNKGIPIVLVTNQLSCPLVPYATTVLKVEASKQQYSIVATIAVLEALVIELGRRTADTSIEHLNKLENVLQERDVTR